MYDGQKKVCGRDEYWWSILQGIFVHDGGLLALDNKSGSSRVTRIGHSGVLLVAVNMELRHRYNAKAKELLLIVVCVRMRLQKVCVCASMGWCWHPGSRGPGLLVTGQSLGRRDRHPSNGRQLSQ